MNFLLFHNPPILLESISLRVQATVLTRQSRIHKEDVVYAGLLAAVKTFHDSLHKILCRYPPYVVKRAASVTPSPWALIPDARIPQNQFP